jgi:hypothetical protein
MVHEYIPVLLKGNSVTRFSTLCFFQQSTRPRALIHGLKPFRIWLRIHQDIRLKFVWKADSAFSMRPRKWIQRYQWDRRSGFSGLNKTVEAETVVSMRPLNPLWHRGSPRQNEYWLSIPLKGYYSKNKYIRKHYT